MGGRGTGGQGVLRCLPAPPSAPCTPALSATPSSRQHTFGLGLPEPLTLTGGLTPGKPPTHMGTDQRAICKCPHPGPATWFVPCCLLFPTEAKFRDIPSHGAASHRFFLPARAVCPAPLAGTGLGEPRTERTQTGPGTLPFPSWGSAEQSPLLSGTQPLRLLVMVSDVRAGTQMSRGPPPPCLEGRQ